MLRVSSATQKNQKSGLHGGANQGAEVATSTLKRIDLAEELTGFARTLWKLQTVLEKAGVDFIPEDDLKGPGVRLNESTRSRVRRKRKSSG